MYKALLLKKIKQHISRGGIIAYPTEACYGLGCDPLNYKAIKKIIQLKRRNKDKGMIAVADRLIRFNKLIMPYDHETQNFINSTYWNELNHKNKQAYSIIYDLKPTVFSKINGKFNSLAIRVSKHKALNQLCHYLKIPISSTSANISGKHTIKNYRNCVKQFGNNVMVLKGDIGFYKKPSSIIDTIKQIILR